MLPGCSQEPFLGYPVLARLTGKPVGAPRSGPPNPYVTCGSTKIAEVSHGSDVSTVNRLGCQSAQPSTIWGWVVCCISNQGGVTRPIIWGKQTCNISSDSTLSVWICWKYVCLPYHTRLIRFQHPWSVLGFPSSLKSTDGITGPTPG